MAAARCCYQTPDLDLTEARLLCEVVRQIEIDADKAAVSPMAVIDRHMRSEEVTVVVVLVGGGHIGFACGNLIEPAIFVLFAQLEGLHVARRAQMVLGAQVGRCSRIENEVGEWSRSTIVYT